MCTQPQPFITPCLQVELAGSSWDDLGGTATHGAGLGVQDPAASQLMVEPDRGQAGLYTFQALTELVPVSFSVAVSLPTTFFVL